MFPCSYVGGSHRYLELHRARTKGAAHIAGPLRALNDCEQAPLGQALATVSWALVLILQSICLAEPMGSKSRRGDRHSGLNAADAYHYRIVAVSAGGTAVGSDQTFKAMSTGGASAVSETSATLNGVLNPQGVSTSYFFQFGTTPFYGLQTTAGDAGTGTGGVAVNKYISVVDAVVGAAGALTDKPVVIGAVGDEPRSSTSSPDRRG